MPDKTSAFSSRAQRWALTVLGLVAIAGGELLPLTNIAGDGGLVFTCFLFVVAVGPICIIAGIVVLVRGRRRRS